MRLRCEARDFALELNALYRGRQDGPAKGNDDDDDAGGGGAEFR